MAGLLNELEAMHNVGLAARALSEYAAAFHAQPVQAERAVTLWHIVTVLPLVFHETSRRAISKRQVGSGLRAILTRDPDNDIAQNEAIFNLTRRIRGSSERTMRALNCAVAWGLVAMNDGMIVPVARKSPALPDGEARAIIRAARKLGAWAGGLSSFEYLTILGVQLHE